MTYPSDSETPGGPSDDAPISTELEWTGERLLPSLKGQIAAEHLHRYALACVLADQKDILDIACGEGYGSYLLARKARGVVGVDNDAASVRHAGKKYGSENLRFMLGDCISIPLDDASVDLVVSFETIEHIGEQERFFDEIRRVLRPGGLLIISTPERENYDDTRETSNPFHVKELSQEEFKGLVRRRFANSFFMSQKFSAASILFPEDESARSEWGVFTGDYREIEFSSKLPTPTYFLALCGDGSLPALPAGWFGFQSTEPDTSAKAGGGETYACVQVYVDGGSGFNEVQSVTKYLPFDTLQTLRFENLGTFLKGKPKGIRIDPSDRPSAITITRLEIISGTGARMPFVVSDADLERFEFVSCVASYGKGEGIVVVSPGNDPQIRLADLPALQDGSFVLEITLKVEIALERISEALNQVTNDRIGKHELERAVKKLKTSQKISESELANTRAQIARSEAHIGNLERHQKDLEKYLAELQNHKGAAEAQVVNLQRRIGSMQNSICWKITRPIRWGDDFVRRQRDKKPQAFTRIPVGAVQAPQRENEPPAKTPIELKEEFRATKENELAAFLRQKEMLTIHKSPAGSVSIIIVLYNQAAFTLACLKALSHEFKHVCEVIIVDNQSTDSTPALLKRIEGATIVASAENLGFLRAVNMAAKQASGDYLLLLNNDAVLRPGSLAAAVRTLESEDDIGAVGGPLVLPDGTLQEAGSIVWNDGSCLGYSRGAAPDSYCAMFRRDVDYCSGAFLLARREAFERLGGFDEEFAPAYYEETDFCLRLWENGLRVVYEPRAAVDHFEFASAIRPEAAIALQGRNQTRFREKHASQLRNHLPPSLDNVLAARQRPPTNGRILVIDDLVPFPERGAGFPRALKILTHFHDAGYFLTLWPIRNPHEHLEAAYELLPHDIEIVNREGVGELEAFLQKRKGYYGIIYISRPHNMAEVAALYKNTPELFTGARIIYDAEAVASAREILKAKLDGNPIAEAEAKNLLDAEVAYAEPADTVIVVSEREAGYFHLAGDARVEVIGHSLIAKPTAAAHGERHGLLFVGRLMEMDSPNTDSILWFASEIFPRIQKELGTDVKLFVVGIVSAAVSELLARDGIMVLGKIDALSEIYGKCRVFVAPTRYAAGIPHKVHDAAAHGLPVVATTLLADQLQWTNEEDLLATDDPDRFALNCVRLYREPEIWERLRKNALERVSSECAPLVFREKVLGLLSQNLPVSDWKPED